MFISPQEWDKLSAFIFIDRKIDSTSSVYLRSRFLLICRFLNENNLPFTRDSFNQFIASKKAEGCRNSYINNIIKVGKYIDDYLRVTYQYDSGLKDYTYFKRERKMFEILEPQECLDIANYHFPYGRECRKTNLIFHAIYLTLTLTGMRVGEVAKLEWADVSHDAIRVRDTKTDNDRIIPNNPLVWEAMEALQGYHPVYVFPGGRNEHIATNTIGYDLRKRVRSLQLKKKIWIHLFRHSFSVEMLRHNDVTIVAKLLGHNDLSSTLTYTHYLMEDMKLAMYTHPLLKEKQTIDNVSVKLKQMVDRFVDKNLFGVSIDEGNNSFKLMIYRK